MGQTNFDINDLLNESSISSQMEKIILSKLNKLVTLIETLHTSESNPKSSNQLNEEALSKEIKATAKLIVKKSNNYSKKAVESVAKQKEEALELLEISKLRVEAELKDLRKRNKTSESEYLAISQKNSFFSIIKFKLYSIFNRSNKKCYSEKPLSFEEQIKKYNLKLVNFEQQKQNISEKYSAIGTQKLEQLRKHTYSILGNTYSTVTSENITYIKNKLNSID